MNSRKKTSTRCVNCKLFLEGDESYDVIYFDILICRQLRVYGSNVTIKDSHSIDQRGCK